MHLLYRFSKHNHISLQWIPYVEVNFSLTQLELHQGTRVLWVKHDLLAVWWRQVWVLLYCKTKKTAQLLAVTHNLMCFIFLCNQLAFHCEPRWIGCQFLEILENIWSSWDSQDMAHAQFVQLEAHCWVWGVGGPFTTLCTGREILWTHLSSWISCTL